MNIITQNPFRVLGLTCNATERELQKQIGIIKRYAEVGKTKSLDYDFEFIGEFKRDSEEIQEASNRIEQAHKKFLYSLFWFVKNNQFDEIAFNNLKEKEIEKAIEIWNKTLKEEITTKNYSSYLNLSTLYIALSTIEEQIDLQKLQTGISLKGNLIHSESLKDLSKLVTGNGVASDPVDISKKFVDEVIELLKPYLNKNKGISTNDLISLFNTFPSNIQKYIASKFTEVPIAAIENRIEKTTKKRKNNPRDAEEYGEELYKSTKSDITLLKKLMGSSNVQYQMLANKLANEIIQCSIDFFNERQENDNIENFDSNLDKTISLVKIAGSVAISDQIKAKVENNLSTLSGMKSKAINEALKFLQSVKDAYKTNEEKIRTQVRELEENDISIRLGHKLINQGAVEDSIKNSLDWGKINIILTKIFTNRILKLIRESDDDKLKVEFLALANWLRQYSLQNSVIFKIIQSYKSIPPKLPFKINSSKITSTENMPLYTKHIRLIGLELDVDVFKDTKVTLYLKYITPSGEVNYKGKKSINEYTLKETKTLEKSAKTIRLLGWGDQNKCIYEVGEHHIEVYYEEHLIHKVSFIVNLAPYDKINNEIIQLNEKLSEEKQKQYFKKELHNLYNNKKKLVSKLNNIINKQVYYEEFNSLQKQLEEIKEWKLFRGQETRNKQILEQQQKIDFLKERERKEKEIDIAILNEQILLENNKIEEIKAKAKAMKEEKISIVQRKIERKKSELLKLK